MTRSPDSLVSSDSGQPEPEKRDDKALTCWQEGEGELAGRNRSKRRYSIVKSTSDYANSAGSFPGASLSLGGEACYGPGYSENQAQSGESEDCARGVRGAGRLRPGSPGL